MKNFQTKLDSKFLKHPPREGVLVKDIQLICPDDDREGCGSCFTATIEDSDESSYESICPNCKKPLVSYWGEYMTFGIKMGSQGLSETKCGQRLKRDRTRRNEKLKTEQWEKHEVIHAGDPEKVRNPTEGSPLDPNSKFNKGKKKKRQVFYKK
jgi:hypothetical protein